VQSCEAGWREPVRWQQGCMVMRNPQVVIKAPPGVIPFFRGMGKGLGNKPAVQWAERWSSVEGGNPSGVIESKIANDSWFNAQAKDMGNALSDFQKAARKSYGTGKQSGVVAHNHPEGIRGAQAVALAR
jgi:hypothetical protein